jgi:HlyD family secretion protein
MEDMRVRRTAVIASIVAIAGAVAWGVASKRNGGTDGRYETVAIERGDLENVITGTGTRSAVGTVEVGTQVSGTIDYILVDFNDRVTKGQVLAALDTTMLAAAVHDAEAGVLRSQAQYEQVQRELQRNEQLFARQFVSEEQLQDARTAATVSHATLLSARAALNRARVNLDYAVIKSPIDGTVIQRNVEPGQTVAASFSTPTLFLIAEDLSKMEIHGLVDESDIGQIEAGQRVSFTVEAYLDETFEGTVRQIRLQPETIQNVVNYTVIIDAANEKSLLYPGMTATIDFIVERVEDVLLVPNKALRLQPTTEMLAQLRKSMEKRMGQLPDSVRAAMEQRRGTRGPGGSGGAEGLVGPGEGGGDIGRLWYLDERGNLRVAAVRKGATDGVRTEISALGPPRGRTGGRSGMSGNETDNQHGTTRALFSGEIEEGMQVISSVVGADKEAAEADHQENRRRGPPMRLF